VSTDNSREWSIDPISSDDPNNSENPIDQANTLVDEVFTSAMEQLSKIKAQHGMPEEANELAKKELRIMYLTEKLELATQIIDQQKATIARLKGDN